MTHSGATAFGSDSGVRLLRNHGLAELVLDRAAKRNALSYEMWSAIPRLVAQVEPGFRS
jgi:enoyl-CoA hydratase/carnithine racemase